MDIQKNTDIDSTYLMHRSFPKEWEPEAVKLTMLHKGLIKIMAKKLYFSHRHFFDKIGLMQDDINSIFVSNVYVFLVKNPSASGKLIGHFLFQRGLKLMRTYARRHDNILENEHIEELTVSVEEISIDYDDPESLLIAKQTLKSILLSKIGRNDL